MDLQLNLKDFSGTFQGSYRVVPKQNDKGFVSLKLSVDFNGKILEDELVTVGQVLNSQKCLESVPSQLKELAKEAERKWGLNLTKAVMNKTA